MRRSRSIAPDYFEQLYATSPDPWGFETSDYERAKYDATIAALDGRCYARGLEVGCSIGVLTQRLARQCAELLAVDASRTALAAARRRCAELPCVAFEERHLPTTLPSRGRFDLIVLSEVVYYWDSSDLAVVAAYVDRVVAPGGDVILVHWTGETDYPKSADEAVVAFQAALSGDYTIVSARREDMYRLDLWRRT